MNIRKHSNMYYSIEYNFYEKSKENQKIKWQDIKSMTNKADLISVIIISLIYSVHCPQSTPDKSNSTKSYNNTWAWAHT